MAAAQIKKLVAITLSLLLVSPFILVAPAWAAITVLNAVESTTGEECDPCTMANMTLSAGTNRKAVCIVAGEDVATSWNVSGVTFGGVAMTPTVQAESTTDENVIEIWELDDASLPAPGDHTVSVDLTESLFEFAVACFVIQGVAQGAASDTDTLSSASANTWNPTVTAPAGSFVLIAAVMNRHTTNTYSYQAGATEVVQASFGATPGASYGAAYEIAETSPSITGSAAAARFAGVVAVWNEAAATVIPAGPIRLD